MDEQPLPLQPSQLILIQPSRSFPQLRWRTHLQLITRLCYSHAIKAEPGSNSKKLIKTQGQDLGILTAWNLQKPQNTTHQ
jgi:hypothetical protein